MRRPRLTDALTNLLSYNEFTSPNVLFNTTNAGTPEKRRVYPDRCPSGGLAGDVSSGLCGFQAPLGTLVGGGPAAVNTRAVSMWVQAVPPSDGISAVDL